MADVRLTATNPEDSSVVPVACDASGRLLLEEPQVVEGPPGPEGQPGPKGDDGKDGDPFSGNFADDVTFGGSASFAGAVITSQINADGSFYITNSGTQKIGLSSIDGSGSFAGYLKSDGNIYTDKIYTSTQSNSAALELGTRNAVGAESTKLTIEADGSAKFIGDVVIGSRNKSWMIVEQSGLAHLVEQASFDAGFGVNDGSYPKLRDIPGELDLIEKALSEVMAKLRLVPPAGWPVWDGSDETQ